MNEQIRNKIQSLEESVIRWRRHLHQNPELSFVEYKTTQYIDQQLADLPGFVVSHPTPTSTVATLDTGRDGRTIAIRADIDALPIQEENDLTFKSIHDGVMHACGHDGHTAILMGVAHAISAVASELVGKIVLIFQHAEEQPPGGAIELYDAGIMDGVDEIYALHLSSAFPTGTFGIRAGVLTSATDEFRIVVKGKGGHSAFPELCVDPVVIGAELIMAIQTIVSRRIAAFDEAVISTCIVNAGTAYNIIPDDMQVIGSVRTFSEATRETIKARLRQIAKGVVDAHGAEMTYEYLYGYDSVINDSALAQTAAEAVTKLYGQDAVLPIEKVFPGEDFSALHKDCPGIFVELGTSDEKKGTNFPHHNARYIMDEDMLIPGVEFFVQMIMMRMNEGD